MRPERRAGAVAALLGAAALGVAWIAEHRLSMAPCALCLMERWPYRVLLAMGLVLWHRAQVLRRRVLA